MKADDENSEVIDPRERRYLRALEWMQAGNACLARGGSEALIEALRSYDEALALVGAHAQEGEAVEAGLLAGAAWLNRAAALGAADRAEAGRSLERAIARLTPLAGLREAARVNLAGAWMNRAEWLRETGDEIAAVEAWQMVLRVASREAGRHGRMLECVLRARHALCVAAAARLLDAAKDAQAGAQAGEALALEAAGQVEAGLAEFAAWRGAAEASRATAARLFEFGAWLVRVRWPEELAGFLARHTEAGDSRRVTAARAAIHLARQEIGRMDFADLLGEAGEARRRVLADLRAVEERLGGAGE